MNFLELLILALALGADAFAVTTAVGASTRGRRPAFRIVFHFGLFQALLALTGALGGALLLRWFDTGGHWLAFALLTVIGLRMIAGALSSESESETRDMTRGMTMVGLSLAVSIDALAAGVSLPAAGADIPLAALMIGLVTTALSTLAWNLTGWIPPQARRTAGVAGGVLLVLLGLRILLGSLYPSLPL